MTPPKLRGITTNDQIMILTLGAVWGLAFVLVEFALPVFSPFAIATLRLTIGAAAVIAVGLALGEQWPRGRKVWAVIFLLGLVNAALPFFLISWGQRGATASEAALLIAATPFITLVVSHLTTRDDRITPLRLLALALGFAGVFVLLAASIFTAAPSTLECKAAILGGALCLGLTSSVLRRMTMLPPLLGMGAILGSAVLYLLPMLLILEGQGLAALDGDAGQAIAAVVGLGLLPTGLAYILRFRLIRAVGASTMSQSGYLVPLFGVFWGWLILGEQPSLALWSALVLVVLGFAVNRHAQRQMVAKTAAGASGESSQI